MEISGQQLLESVPLGILITDLSGNVTEVNHRLLGFLGRTSTDVAGHPLTRITPDEYYEADSNALAAIGMGDRADSYIKELETADGSLIPVEVYPGAVLDGNKITHALFVVKALSEEMELLQQLQRRNAHLMASSEVSKASTQIHDIDELLTKCVDLIRSHFGFYYAAIFLIDEANEWAVLKAATGQGGRNLLEKGHKLGVGSQSMVGWVTTNNQARIALDVGEEAIRFDNPELPKTRSEIALPLRVRGTVIGVLDAQSTLVNAFSSEDIRTIQMMADQVAIAIDNARMFGNR